MRYQISNAKGKMRYEKIRAFLYDTGVNVRPIIKVSREQVTYRQPVWLNVDRQLPEK